VPDVLPFPGIRYDCGAAGAELGMLAAPPYDVVDEELHGALEANHERNSVRLILPRDPADGGDRYARAAATFRAWLAEGVLFRDSVPRFYGYRMRYRDARGEPRHTHGVIGALTLPERDATDVLPHERTLPKAKTDRLSLLTAMRVNVDPIWCLTLRSGLTDLLEPATPLCSCTDEDGVEHELYAIDDAAQVAAITDAIREAPLVLADGHHRFETACNYREQLRAEGAEVGGANAIMTLVVELSEDELWIDAIHRLVTVPDGVDVRAALADAFTIEPLGPNSSARSGRARPRRPARRRTRDPPRRHRRTAARPGARSCALHQRRARRTRRGPPASRRDVGVPARCVRGRRARRQGCGERRPLVRPGVGRTDARCGPRGRAHAAEDDVLLPEAADRDGVPDARLIERARRARARFSRRRSKSGRP
jgi:uncharacterized protein (DUF1015 family)